METELKHLRIDREARRTNQSNPNTRRFVYAGLGIVALVLIVFAYRKLNAATPVHVAEVQAPGQQNAEGGGSEQTILSATGYIIAAHKIEVASKVIGRVAQINVDKGDRVQVGQVLVRLEDDEYRAQVQQQRGNIAYLEARLEELKNGSRPEEISKAHADVDQAKSDLANARVTFDRTKSLMQEGVLSQQALDDAQAKLDGAQSKVDSLQRTMDLAVLGPRAEQISQLRGQLEQARGALAYAQTQLDNTVIRAPVTGTILDRNVEKGEFVTTGFVGDKGAKGYLVTMADLNYLQVELDISQNDFPKLGPKQKGTVTTDAYPDRKYKGFVEQVSPEADRAKATVQVKVRIDNPDNFLRPDMNATVAFYNEASPKGEGQQTERQPVNVPEGAVQNGNVYVVVNGRARKRAVSTNGTSQRGVLVTSGLIGGEEIVMNPPATLKDGSRVEITK